ncbi:MAG TPA: ATPase, partial [Casimicrobiaceae bacterium]
THMQQLRQRVIASYHLGPMDKSETQAYVEHRLTHVGWKGDPSFDPATFDVIHARSGGIPRRINTLCNRLLLAGFLGEKHALVPDDVEAIASEIREELGPQDTLASLRAAAYEAVSPPAHPAANGSGSTAEHLRDIEERIERLEKTVGGAVDLLHRLLHRDKVGKPGASAGR